MGYECKILLDSISETGKRLTTFEITFPRIVLAEFNTHRMFSRNFASSRAIPFNKQVERVVNYPFIPEKFPLNVKGMQPAEYLEKDIEENKKGNLCQYDVCYDAWISARNSAIEAARYLYESNNVHKQIVNRLLEPFMWHTVICTATEFSNFFKLRCDENAQYEIRRIANLMYDAYHAFDEDKFDDKDIIRKGIPDGWIAIRPQKLKVGEWHCPLISDEDNLLIHEFLCKSWEKQTGGHPDDMPLYPPDKEFIEIKKKISVARCARVSYLTHDGKRDIEKDLELFERLRTSGHWSPFEHVATPYFMGFGIEQIGTDLSKQNLWSGNFLGWKQYRKEFQDENCTNFKKEN